MKDKVKQIKFKVIDNITGKDADIGEIALKEDWAKGLMYCDMEGFAILEDGNLVLLDECGKWEYCPNDRFTVVFEDSVVIPKEISCYENIEERVRTFRLDGNKVDFTSEQIMALTQIFHFKEKQENEIRKETAEKILNETEWLFRFCGQLPYLEELKKQFGVEIKEVNNDK